MLSRLFEAPSLTRMLCQNRCIVGNKETGPVDKICENVSPYSESPTAEILRFSHSRSQNQVLQNILEELGKRLRKRMDANRTLREVRETLDRVGWSIASYSYAMFMVRQGVPLRTEDGLAFVRGGGSRLTNDFTNEAGP
ncbi:E3 SUMO-protein ligase [Colletotrichum tofieldiae]|uniref:E3 SUMO-protein ligase n=1 Tax=Colletotrichum tofieldiae TaxID=708197 RepID=A0A166YYB2_9PEZI|nr:E3 SUMO-protein ligase [Colletotrichum tofieldiae]